ncbi:MAG: glycosyltransferase family 39 protein [Planctomycetes bacterium]|nr:glycosyltransferase family 39 protein [Planctomycetota bacterium]
MSSPPRAPSSRIQILFFAAALAVLYLFFVPLGEMADPQGPPSSLARLLNGIFGVKMLQAEEHPHFLLLAAGLRLGFLFLASLAPALAALVLGRRILAWTHLEPGEKLESWIFALAAGYGGLALTTLALGVTAGLLRPLFLLGVAGLCILGVRDLAAVRADVESAAASVRGHGLGRVLAASAPALLLMVLAALAACVPPLDYDALEYHLGAPAEYYRAGRIDFIRYNVYSNFPFNTEMLYLLCTVIAGDLLTGAFLAQCVNLQLGLLCAAAVGMAGWRIFNPRAGFVAALVFLISPWFTRSAIKAYDTLALSLYAFLAVYAFYRHVQSPDAQAKPTLRWLALAAVTAGLAMGTKYPAFLFVGMPLALATAAFGIARKTPAPALGRQLALAALIPLLLVSPWLIKNAVHTHNPIYPLLGNLFPGPEWDAEREARFVRAHRAEWLGPLDLLREAGYRAFLAEGSSPLFIVFLPALLWLGEGRRASAFFLGYTALFFLLWACFTHRIDRFLVPALPGLCLLAGAGFSACIERPVRTVAGALLAGLLAFHTFEGLIVHAHLDGLQVALGIETPEEYLRRVAQHTNFPAEAVGYLNREVGPKLNDGERVLFLGDAETFYCDRNYFLSATVFDRQWLDEAFGSVPGESLRKPGPEDVLRALRQIREWGVTHLYVNWPEIYRLQTSYAYNDRGEERPGYLKCLGPLRFPPGLPESSRFSYFVEREYRVGLFSPGLLGGHLKEVQRFGPSEAPQPPLFAIYRIESK